MSRTIHLFAVIAGILVSGCIGAATEPALDAASTTGNLGGAPGVTVTSVFPGEYDFSGPYALPLERGPLAILPPERVVIPSDLDGAAIEMGIHRPQTDERVPVIVMAGPYFSVTGSFGSVMAQSVEDHPLGQNNWFGHLVETFAPHGYAVVGLAVRGTGGSGGCNDFAGPKEQADLDQAISWLGEQAWSSGAIGMTGMSYDGGTPYLVAALGNPYLKTIVPANGVVDEYGDQFRNGTTADLGGHPGRTGAYYALNTAQPEGVGPEAGVVERIACLDAFGGIAAEYQMNLDGTDPTGYWEARDRRDEVLANYRGSVFAVTGLQDWNVAPDQYVPFIDQLDQAGIRVKQMYAQYGHNFPGIVGGSESRQEIAKLHRADYDEILLRWFDRELKGLDVDVGAPVQVADDLHRWRNEAHYPPHDTTWTTWHLTPEGFAPEPGEPARVALGSRSVRMQGSCIENPPFSQLDAHGLFSFPPAEEDTLIVGLPRVHVAITPETPHTQLFATLCETTADGEARFLSQTTMDLAFADGTRERRQPAPGETLQAMMELQPMDSVVRAGSTLSLQLWINDNSETRRSSWIPSGSATLELGHSIPSVLELPTIVRGPEVYFEPPRP